MYKYINNKMINKGIYGITDIKYYVIVIVINTLNNWRTLRRWRID